MTYKQTREKVKNILIGAGMNWNEEYEYFDYDDSQCKCIVRAMVGLETGFGLSTLSNRPILNLPCFDDLDEITDLIMRLEKEDE